MIKLDIEDYCQDCNWFEPELAHIHGFDEPITVVCERKRHCERLVSYLKRELKKEVQNE